MPTTPSHLLPARVSAIKKILRIFEAVGVLLRRLFLVLPLIGWGSACFATDYFWMSGGGLIGADPHLLCERVGAQYQPLPVKTEIVYPDPSYPDNSRLAECRFWRVAWYGLYMNSDSFRLGGTSCTAPKIWDEQTLSCRILPLPDPSLELASNKGDPNDDLSCNAPGKAKGNPINLSMGNKFQKEEDYRGSGAFPLQFTRYYNSLDGFWRHTYAIRLKSFSSQLTLIRADGRESRFSLDQDMATAGATELGRLVKNGTGWRYISPAQEQYEFDSQGRLLRWSNSNGQFHKLSYAINSVTVVDASGNSLNFTQDAYFQPLTFNSSELSIGYQYNGGKLKSTAKAQASNNEIRKYHHGDSRFPYALTGITDERGIRYATWTYDDQGRAISSEHAGGTDKVLIAYNADGSSTVTNALGKKATYRFQTIKGVKRITAIEGEPSPNCPNSNSTFTYDERGLLKTKTDNKGHLTTYAYSDRGLEVSRTEAAGTPQARTITTEWHPSLFLPVSVAEPSRITHYTYDDQGRQLSQSVTQR
jgi:YD repeat-containing protein